MRLWRNLTGERTVHLALYADANGNDGFDPATDTACGGQATVTHNFSASRVGGVGTNRNA